MEHNCGWCGSICEAGYTAIVAQDRICEHCREKLGEQFSNLFGGNAIECGDPFGLSVRWDVIQLLVIKALRDDRKHRTVFYIDDSDVAKLK